MPLSDSNSPGRFEAEARTHLPNLRHGDMSVRFAAYEAMIEMAQTFDRLIANEGISIPSAERKAA